MVDCLSVENPVTAFLRGVKGIRGAGLELDTVMRTGI